MPAQAVTVTFELGAYGTRTGCGGNSDTTSLTEYVTGKGEFVTDVTAESADGEVKIIIPKGTTGKNRNGQPLRFISIKKVTTYSEPPEDHEFICIVHNG